MSVKRKLKVVLVEWTDQNSFPGPEEWDNCDCEVIGQTAGILVKRTKDWITLASDYFSHQDQVRHIINIPMVCVRKIKRLEGKKP